FEDLERTVARKLSAGEGETGRVGDALLVAAEDPVEAARRLALLPGVAWIAVGYRFSGTSAYLSSLTALAGRYLLKGRTFKISAQVAASKRTAGDAVLAGNSELLSSVPGTRVDERKPHVRFRVCIRGAKGACGAEIRSGPGGIPTTKEWVSCLVSGGRRSSALSWMAALSGFSLRLVHSRADEASLRQVARLYSELSFRMDPRCLELVVLGGGDDTYGRIGGWLRDHKEAAFAGLRPRRPDALTGMAERFPNLALPLTLVQDDAVEEVYRSLGLGRAAEGHADGGLTLKALEAVSPYSARKFGGVQADSNEVIDTLKKGA
ncbi:MAG: hypothetical protein OK442_08210, partial [Thaumarchaeota archaeon]|nr:hypothetical protein [Nitrososphaerota archaeon]